ncbi:PAS domain-containing protein [Hymenobacter mucosus]|uniref:histidine kinase n=1 Tax=Hymenobacter mucosus TaxID=1411120 RepID=A0A238ZZZ6_9BACT|nr:PAS domain-containing protein [Hymenobacter mucosus]SNR88438.1 PAS domain S-box-containing protein [Hymenobacter mucosus]
MSLSPDVELLLAALPQPCLLLSPAFVIEAVSDAYLAATLTRREQLVGQTIFAAFPDNPQTPQAQGPRNLLASLQQVLATGQPHQMAPQRYDVPDPARPGQFVERHWQPRNSPVLDAQGRVAHLLHVAQDVTADVQAHARLLDSQAAAEAARAEAEMQRQRFYELLMQLPAHVAVHEGPDQVFTLVNPYYQRLAPGRDLLGQPIREAWPELVGQGILDVLDGVYRTGEPFVGTELPFQVDFARAGQPEQVYFNAFFLPLRGPEGQVRGVLDFSYDVTEQVRARQQLQQLNQELEARVAERTAQLAAALARAEQQHQLLHQLLGQVPASLAALAGPEHRHVFSNDAYRAWTGQRAAENVPLAACCPELAAQGFVARLDEVYRTGRPFAEAELALALHDPATGQRVPRFADVLCQPLTDGAGQVTGTLVFSVDVTEQVRARRQNEALQAQVLAAAQAQAQERELQRQRLHRFFEQAPAAVAILSGPDLVYELVNPGYQALFPDRPLAGQPLLRAFPEIAGHPVHHTFRQVYETGRTHQELGMCIPVARTAGGPLEERYFNYIQQARHDEHGQVDGVLVFAFEVTAQVQAQQRAERSEARFRHLAETTPMVVWEADAQGQTTYLSPHWERFTTAANGQGLGWQQYVHPDDQQPFLQAWLAAVAGGQPFQAELRLRVAATGQYRWHLDRAVPVLGTAGNVLQWVGAAIDIHEQKQAEQGFQDVAHQLTAANAQLTRTNRDLDNFIYTASHDLKSPITNIEGLLLALRQHLAEDGPAQALVPQLLDMMQGAVERFQLTIAQLTDLTRLQQAPDEAPETVDLTALVEAVCLDLGPALTAARAQVQVDVAACPTVSFTPRHLRSIVYNLLSNAVKYADPARHPVVQLRAHCTPRAVFLAVTDNGLGLTEEQQAQLFGLFRRLHSHVEGSGVGLYTVKKIVDNAGGTITVRSQPGQGSTFTIQLPLAAGEPAAG